MIDHGNVLLERRTLAVKCPIEIIGLAYVEILHFLCGFYLLLATALEHMILGPFLAFFNTYH